VSHPLWRPAVVGAIERAASAHRGRPWTARGFTDLDDRASHPCGILHGEPFSVFAKLNTAADAAAQASAELRGLALLRDRAGVATPTPIHNGQSAVDGGTLLLTEALTETPPQGRTAADWRRIRAALAAVRGVTGERFGLDFDTYSGPLRQDNRPVPGDRWADFFAIRRVAPRLREAADSGYLPAEVATGVERIIPRLPELCGPELPATLVHGDAQQNNMLSTADAAVLLDPSPYFGHPEVDLALLDYFWPVPGEAFDGYRDVATIDAGLPSRRDLWRLPAYLAVVTVDGANPFGRRYLGRLAEAVDRYR
jgi:fructosamine-3-kinase